MQATGPGEPSRSLACGRSSPTLSRGGGPLGTDVGFYELRSSGRPATFVRGVRALYLGVLFNVLVMATVSLAALKIGQVKFGLSSTTTLAWASAGIAIYAVLGGLTGSVWADFYQYSVAMAGAIAAAVYAVKSP